MWFDRRAHVVGLKSVCGGSNHPDGPISLNAHVLDFLGDKKKEEKKSIYILVTYLQILVPLHLIITRWLSG